MCIIMRECISTKPRHKRGQRSLQSGQAVFMLAKELQVGSESVFLGLDIISQLVLVNFSKQTSGLCTILYCHAVL